MELIAREGEEGELRLIVECEASSPDEGGREELLEAVTFTEEGGWQSVSPECFLPGLGGGLCQTDDGELG